MVAGADSIDDMAVLRHGAMGTVFDRPYAPSTLGSFLREFTFGHVRQQEPDHLKFRSYAAAKTGWTHSQGTRQDEHRQSGNRDT